MPRQLCIFSSLGIFLQREKNGIVEKVKLRMCYILSFFLFVYFPSKRSVPFR